MRALALLALILQASPEPDGPPRARSHTIVGELVRVDVGRRSVTLKATEAGRAREYEVGVDEATRISSGGRVARLEDLRAGDRALATCADDEPGKHRAVLLKLGPPRPAQERRTPAP